MRAVLLMLICLTMPLLAADPVFTNEEWDRAQAVQRTSATPGATAAPATGPALVSIGLSLAAVVTLAVVLGWVVKKAGVKRLLPRRGEHLEVLESLPLAFKRQVYLVLVGDQVVLVGSGEHELTTLGSFPAAPFTVPPAPAAAAPAPSPASPVDGRFAGLLDQALGRKP